MISHQEIVQSDYVKCLSDRRTDIVFKLWSYRGIHEVNQSSSIDIPFNLSQFDKLMIWTSLLRSVPSTCWFDCVMWLKVFILLGGEGFCCSYKIKYCSFQNVVAQFFPLSKVRAKTVTWKIMLNSKIYSRKFSKSRLNPDSQKIYKENLLKMCYSL